MTSYFRFAGATWLLVGLFVSGAVADSVRVAPSRVQSNKPVWILAKGTPDVPVKFTITSGTECGALSSADGQTNEQGEAKAVFTASDVPTDCDSTVSVTISRAKDVAITDAGNTTITRKIEVVPLTAAVSSLDATTAITIILIASFAIDRLVTLLMTLLPLGKLHGERAPELQKKRERLTYIALAGLLGLLLGYFGNIQLLAGLGFSSNVALNAIVTALILTAGSDSISALLKRMGGSSLPEVEQKPLIVQGDLTLHRPERGRAAGQGGGGTTEGS